MSEHTSARRLRKDELSPLNTRMRQVLFYYCSQVIGEDTEAADFQRFSDYCSLLWTLLLDIPQSQSGKRGCWPGREDSGALLRPLSLTFGGP